MTDDHSCTAEWSDQKSVEVADVLGQSLANSARLLGSHGLCVGCVVMHQTHALMTLYRNSGIPKLAVELAVSTALEDVYKGGEGRNDGDDKADTNRVARTPLRSVD